MPFDALMERLVAADLASDSAPEQAAAEALLQELLKADASFASTHHETGLYPRRRLARWRHRRIARWAPAAVVVAGAAVAALAVGVNGNGPSDALAGWSAHPTEAASGQLQAAEATCKPTLAQMKVPSGAWSSPTVADTRGPFSLLFYTDSTGNVACLTGWPSGGAMGNGAGYGPDGLPPVAPGTITAGESGGEKADGQAFRQVEGQAGAGVSSVTLTLADGSSVQATIANGWFVAWWPGTQPPTTAEVTTATGTLTQQLSTASPSGVTPSGSTAASG